MPTQFVQQIALFSQQPFVADGLAGVLKARNGWQLESFDTLPNLLAYLDRIRPRLIIINLGVPVGLNDLRELCLVTNAPIALWGGAIGSDFAFQAVQAGVRGILPSKMSTDEFVCALEEICNGGMWVDKSLVGDLLNRKQITLTRREQQLIALVSQGLKNKEIAFALGISEGTVKVYMSRLFTKLALKDRLDLALYGLRNAASGYMNTIVPVEQGRLPSTHTGTRSFLLPGAEAVKGSEGRGPVRSDRSIH